MSKQTALERRLAWWVEHRRTCAFPPAVLLWTPVATLVRRTWLTPVGGWTTELGLMLWLERAVLATLEWLLAQPDPGAAARTYEVPGTPAWRAWLNSGPWREALRGPALFRHRCDDCAEVAVVDDPAVATCLACGRETEHGADVPF